METRGETVRPKQITKMWWGGLPEITDICITWRIEWSLLTPTLKHHRIPKVSQGSPS